MDIQLDKTKICRYLGYTKQIVEEDIENLIDEAIEKIKQTANPRYIFEIFDIALTDFGVEVKSSSFKLSGRGVSNHLKGSNKCVFLGATLGVEVDSALRLLQMSSMTRAVIFDACADEYIEKVCDQAEAEIKTLGYRTTFRYSPGYKDFPIENQRALLTLVNAQRIGLSCNECFLLMPQKSVTAVIGLL
ncbi:MAG: methionine synthase [Nitrososphaerota archaeon]|jgi:hypothetical protein|nr:methionine synthase [Nitrososphaerota archaeon]